VVSEPLVLAAADSTTCWGGTSRLLSVLNTAGSTSLEFGIPGEGLCLQTPLSASPVARARISLDASSQSSTFLPTADLQLVAHSAESSIGMVNVGHPRVHSVSSALKQQSGFRRCTLTECNRTDKAGTWCQSHSRTKCPPLFSTTVPTPKTGVGALSAKLTKQSSIGVQLAASKSSL